MGWNVAAPCLGTPKLRVTALAFLLSFSEPLPCLPFIPTWMYHHHFQLNMNPASSSHPQFGFSLWLPYFRSWYRPENTIVCKFYIGLLPSVSPKDRYLYVQHSLICCSFQMPATWNLETPLTLFSQMRFFPSQYSVPLIQHILNSALHCSIINCDESILTPNLSGGTILLPSISLPLNYF